MSEWQPARCRPVHRFDPRTHTVPIDDLKARSIRVRPTTRQYYPEEREILGCDASKFYEVHPQDCFEGCGDLICEHELLTD